VVFVDNGKHGKNTMADGVETIEFEAKDGVVNYMVHSKGQVTAEKAPNLKKILTEKETERLAHEARVKTERVDLVSLL